MTEQAVMPATSSGLTRAFHATHGLYPGRNRPDRHPRRLEGLAALLPCTGENRVEYGTITPKNPEMNLTRGGRT